MSLPTLATCVHNPDEVAKDLWDVAMKLCHCIVQLKKALKGAIMGAKEKFKARIVCKVELLFQVIKRCTIEGWPRERCSCPNCWRFITLGCCNERF